MISEYTSFRPPKQARIKMVKGPAFFANFAGGWSFREIDAETTETMWRYTFSTRPSLLRAIADRIGVAMLTRDIERRIKGFAAGCTDDVVLSSLSN